MKLSYISYLSAASLRKRKLRSFLTIGGMMIGVGVIVFLVSLGFGLQKIIRERVANIDALTILDVSTGASTLLQINQQTVDRFAALEHVTGVSQSLSVSGQLLREGTATDVGVFGINPDLLDIENIRTSIGTTFSNASAQETILTTTATELLGYENPNDILGEQVTFRLLVPVATEGDATASSSLAGEVAAATDEGELAALETHELPVTVVGVIDDAELSIGYLPLSLLVPLGLDDFNLARVKVDDQNNLAEVRAVIEAQGFQVDSVADTIGQIDQIFLIFQIVMAALGFIALFIASLGAFNTLTVSLLERTREVGIMRALGAKGRDIYRLFLIEAIFIGISGGFLGVLLGWVLGQAANMLLNILAARFGGEQLSVFLTPFYFVLFILALSFTASVLTGFYPARRASKINPLDALRYE